MVEAIPEALSHQQAFVEFDTNLRRDRSEEVQEWEIEYNAWVAEPTGSPCIFDTSEPSKFFDLFQRLQRLTMAKEQSRWPASNYSLPTRRLPEAASAPAPRTPRAPL